MNNQSLDTPENRETDPPRFKLAASILLILLGTLGFLGSFAQMLSYIFYVNNWFSVLLSMLQLLTAIAVALAGTLMLLRRATPERMTPRAGIIGTAALVLLDLAGSLVRNGTVSGAVLPSLMAAAIFILLGLSMRHLRH